MAGLKNNSAIAFFVDGLEVKAAKLSSKKGAIVLDELESVTLPTRLDEGGASESSALDTAADQGSDGFGGMGAGAPPPAHMSDVGSLGTRNWPRKIVSATPGTLWVGHLGQPAGPMNPSEQTVPPSFVAWQQTPGGGG